MFKRTQEAFTAILEKPNRALILSGAATGAFLVAGLAELSKNRKLVAGTFIGAAAISGFGVMEASHIAMHQDGIPSTRPSMPLQDWLRDPGAIEATVLTALEGTTADLTKRQRP
jgi:hypothetical protein